MSLASEHYEGWRCVNGMGKRSRSAGHDADAVGTYTWPDAAGAAAVAEIGAAHTFEDVSAAMA